LTNEKKPLVFISHSGQETAAARTIAEALSRANLEVWLDEESLRPGDVWMEELERAIERAGAFVVYVGRDGVRRWVDAEVRLALDRSVRDPAFRLLPVLGPGADPDALPAFLKQYHYHDCRDGLGDLGGLAEALTEAPPSAGETRPPPVEHPFRGLLPFEAQHSLLFFGREQETEELLSRLRQDRFLAVIGGSGSGKSSLIRAGLIPALHRGRFHDGRSWVHEWRVALFRPGERPLRELVKALSDLTVAPAPTEAASAPADVGDRLLDGRSTLAEAVSALVEPGPHTLIVVDQLEELFTTGEWTAEKERFLDELLDTATPRTERAIHVLTVLRADFFSDCWRHAQLLERISANQYLVSRIRRSQLRLTIEKPLALAGARAEEGLVDRILQDVGEEPGSLPLLQHALSQLWGRRVGTALTHRAYEAIGRLSGALRNHANDVFDNHLRSSSEKDLAREIFLRLAQFTGDSAVTRRSARKSELLALAETKDAGEHVLEELTGERLIVTHGGGDEDAVVEVSHEALLREWPRFQGWLEDSRESLRLERRLVADADDWEASNRDPDLLLKGSRLHQAQEWGAKRPRGLTGRPTVFLEASTELDEHERNVREKRLQAELDTQKRLTHRTRALVVVLAVGLVAAAALTRYAWTQMRTAQSRELAARARQLQSSDPRSALATAVEAARMRRTIEAEQALGEALTLPRVRFSLGHDKAVTGVSATPDGRLLATASEDHSAIIWDGAQGKVRHVLKGHIDALYRVRLSRDGARVLTTSGDGTARIWDAGSGGAIAILQGHSKPVYDGAFSPDGRRVATAGGDGTARLWEALDGTALATLSGHEGAVMDVSFSEDGSLLATSGADGTARVWDTDTARLRETLRGHRGPVRHVEFDATGRRVATASEDGTARVWLTEGGRLDQVLVGHRGPVMYAVFSPDSRLVATAGADSTVRLWDAGSGVQSRELQGHVKVVLQAHFSADGKRVISASEDGTARVWDTETGAMVQALFGHGGPVLAAGFLGSSLDAVTASADGTAWVWNLRSQREHQRLLHASAVLHVAFSPEGTQIATGEVARVATIWDLESGEALLRFEGHDAAVRHVAFSPNGSLLVTASSDGTARLWRRSDGSLLTTLSGHGGEVCCAVFSPDGARVLTAAADGEARLWEVPSGKALHSLRGHLKPIREARFSRNGGSIVTASSDHTARVWDAETGQARRVLTGHDGPVQDARFSPDGSLVVTASEDRTARVWRTLGGEVPLVLRGHTDGVLSAVFSPNGRHILTGSRDGTARLWEVTAGLALRTFRGHEGWVSDVGFSPDGGRIVTAGNDGTVRVWDARTAELVHVLRGHQRPVRHALFSPDGRYVVSAGNDGTIRVYLATIEGLLDLAVTRQSRTERMEVVP